MKSTSNSLFSRDVFRILGNYVFGKGADTGKNPKTRRLNTPEALGACLEAHASHVAQTSLYGYLKTRAGTRFPSLFENSEILASINIAKWHIWLACLSDLAVYSGVLLRQRTDVPEAQIREMLGQMVADVLARTGTPAEAGDDFAAAADKLSERIARADLAQLADDDSAFTESPAALVYWSPVADHLKNRDVEIVRNSIRFRWQEVRRNLRRQLQAEAIFAALP